MSAFYSYEWTDGKAFLADIEPDVVVDIQEVDGEPVLKVYALLIDGINILNSLSPTIKALAKEIKEKIEADEEWCGERLREEGWLYKSRGGTDPSGHWAQR